MKYILLSLIFIIAVFSIILFTTYTTTRNELAQMHNTKTHELCDSNLSQCGKKFAPNDPKGVCKPGGACS